MSGNQEAQEDELLALTSIYDEEEFHRAESAQGGEIQLCLELPAEFRVVVKGQTQTEYNVCFLPPLVLNFELPEDYPSTSPPIFTLSSKWMSAAQMSRLCRRLDELWEENQGCEILFTWIQFLKEETLDFLGIVSPLEISRRGSKAGGEHRNPDPAVTSLSQGPCESSETTTVVMKEKTEPQLSTSSQLDPRAIPLLDPCADLLPQLLDFDEARRQKAFDAKIFCCGICFVEKQGSGCLCFKECQHVYCKACMTEYFQIQIRDGNVQCLYCPEHKCTSLATPLQVKQLVDEDLFARYDRLLLQSSLDLMADVVYCPRQSCGTAVMVEPDTTMGICSACHYAFCTLCKMGYHGLSHCKITADELRNLRDEYLSSTAEGKKFMEQRFGKRVIQKAVEESYSRDWLKENCKNCPRCGTNIQKVDGCNKMTCTSCKQYFCWLCMGVLSRLNPYSHFNNANSPCYNQLFHGVDLEAEEAFWSDEED
ncbi:E3 ubiquitin-protein ligase RNF14 [Takifugu rubripes]|uniref:E3 ubiquitin-protein ligase RNF14 n=2 Tax=Takifugu TaxID=31032 RepID=H2TBV8_TAKRU|nr:E3 ubiquitin-protein ligase RNF14 [Takifugu rubripes]XP_056910061.1 E3 ubiquitin-protein ligase RNF14 [Takifugu flavidus]TWW75150.1 E3 ubiquitin-protein ligase RNF14 [Takifugu flavidus]|eukprot:XP_011609593.1 PREDICTED: E3 ubiquitin-protein ligase RNF14 [Takifugu rubripes]